MAGSDLGTSSGKSAVFFMLVCAVIFAIIVTANDWKRGTFQLIGSPIALLFAWLVRSNRSDPDVDSSWPDRPFEGRLADPSTSSQRPSMPISQNRPEKDPLWDRWLDG